MRYRPAFLLLALALVGASCGQSRDAADTSRIDDAAGAVSADSGEGEGEDNTGGEAQTDTSAVTTPPSTAPATTAPAGDVAVSVDYGDGSSSEFLHGELNDIVVPTRENEEFVALVYQGSVPPGFDAVVLSQSVIAGVMDNELAKLDAEPTPEVVDEARTLLFGQLEQLMVASTDPTAEVERLYGEVPYLPFIVSLQARQIALSEALAASAPEDDGAPCVRHILLENEADATSVLDELSGGGDFAVLAAERSVGPTGPDGGDLGCAPASNYVPEFATAVTEAELGEFVGPVETQFGWHVIVVDRFEVNGDQLAQEQLTEGLTDATVTVDERVGLWDTERLTIVPVGS